MIFQKKSWNEFSALSKKKDLDVKKNAIKAVIYYIMITNAVYE